MSAEEGMRREMGIAEQTKTAENLAFYASSVSTSAATFPMGEGLVRRNMNGRKIATAVRWLRQFSIFHRHCEPVTDVTGVAIRSPFVGTQSTLIVLGARIATSHECSSQ